jgi:hypothetical protein
MRAGLSAAEIAVFVTTACSRLRSKTTRRRWSWRLMLSMFFCNRKLSGWHGHRSLFVSATEFCAQRYLDLFCSAARLKTLAQPKIIIPVLELIYLLSAGSSRESVKGAGINWPNLGHSRCHEILGEAVKVSKRLLPIPAKPKNMLSTSAACRFETGETSAVYYDR